MPTTIKLAGVEDVERLAELNAVVHGPHAEQRPDYFRPPGSAELPDWYRARLAEPGTRCLLALRGDRAVAYLLAFLRERPANAFCEPWSWMEIDQIAVEPGARNAGVARALFEAACEHARAAGAHALELNVWCFNTEAQAVFESFGFRPRALRMERELV